MTIGNRFPSNGLALLVCFLLFLALDMVHGGERKKEPSTRFLPPAEVGKEGKTAKKGKLLSLPDPPAFSSKEPAIPKKGPPKRASPLNRSLQSQRWPAFLPAVNLFGEQLPHPSQLPAPKGGVAVAPPLYPGALPLYQTPVDAPLGYTRPSGVLPSEVQTDPHFVPMEDRWRIGFPDWDRYGKGHPPLDDYPYQLGNWWDPFSQNVLKGDYPILGQNTFLDITAISRTQVEPRLTPIATTPFESTARPFENNFFGRPNQAFVQQFFSLSFDLFHGDAAFKPVDWRVRVTPVFNLNHLTVQELATINPDVRYGVSRTRTLVTLQEWFVETKIADLSPNYDFFSVRAGAQPFVNDFRGFIFADTNRAIRLFGTRSSNREQFNLVYFRQMEKGTNSELNTFHDRHQDIIIANYYLQDFVWPGYTLQFNAVYNHDSPTFKFDKNHFLVRPDGDGVFTPHEINALYLGWTGDGHINRFNITHALYWVFGHDSLNPLANKQQDISAFMGAAELSYDRDWMRFRTSIFFTSGDHNINNSHATGFDAVFDNPNFAGGQFSYWQRQAIRIFNVNLVNRDSLTPNLRASKIQGQTNFVNPGLLLLNGGVDLEVSPRCRIINNANFLWFNSVEPLRQFTYQQRINNFIGIDLSMGVEYRPWLSNNVILTCGVSTLIPGTGFRNLFNDFNNSTDTLFAGFMDLILMY